MPKERIHFPETLPGATKFSGENRLNDPELLVRAFKDASWISRPLIEEAEALASPSGRRRMKGSWVLVAVGFIASRQGDIPALSRAGVEGLLGGVRIRRPTVLLDDARAVDGTRIAPT